MLLFVLYVISCVISAQPSRFLNLTLLFLPGSPPKIIVKYQQMFPFLRGGGRESPRMAASSVGQVPTYYV